jgi:mersacidin/lichenicidin family type 2 lantibiotic
MGSPDIRCAKLLGISGSSACADQKKGQSQSMTRDDIIRAWKDVKFRSTLSKEQLAELPPNPIGTFELTEEELTQAAGAGGTGGSSVQSDCCWTNPTCNEFCDL